MDAARLMKAAPIGVPVRSGCPDTEGGPCGAERTAVMVDRSMFSHCGDAMFRQSTMFSPTCACPATPASSSSVAASSVCPPRCF